MIIVIIMDQPESEWKRECPQCKCEITYRLRTTCDRAEKRGTLCKRCGIKNAKNALSNERRIEIGLRISASKQSQSFEKKQEIQRKRKETLANWSDERRKEHQKLKSELFSRLFTGEGNPFYGHHHDQSTIERLKAVDRSYTKTSEFSQSVKDAMVGIDTSVDLVKIWTEQFGVEEAIRRETERRKKLSNAMSGERNPMFGKPAPLAAGAGIKGWYRDRFFRSLRELSYMLCLDREGKRWKTGETQDYAISYVNPYTGARATYYPDFIVDDCVMVECKPSNLHGTLIVRAKTQAARTMCEQHNMTYVLVDPEMISIDELRQLEQNGSVKLTEKTKENIDAYAHLP